MKRTKRAAVKKTPAVVPLPSVNTLVDADDIITAIPMGSSDPSNPSNHSTASLPTKRVQMDDNEPVDLSEVLGRIEDVSHVPEESYVPEESVSTERALVLSEKIDATKKLSSPTRRCIIDLVDDSDDEAAMKGATKIEDFEGMVSIAEDVVSQRMEKQEIGEDLGGFVKRVHTSSPFQMLTNKGNILNITKQTKSMVYVFYD